MTIYTLKSDLPISVIDSVKNKGNYQIQVQANSVSDGYHTMGELYDHRMALTIALFNTYNRMASSGIRSVYVGRSKLHSDGTMFEGYFIVYAKYNVGMISYHYKLEHWDKFNELTEYDKAPEYDGHTSADVIERLLKL